MMMNKKYCTKCGAAHALADNFCSKCGFAFNSPSNKSVASSIIVNEPTEIVEESLEFDLNSLKSAISVSSGPRGITLGKVINTLPENEEPFKRPKQKISKKKVLENFQKTAGQGTQGNLIE